MCVEIKLGMAWVLGVAVAALRDGILTFPPSTLGCEFLASIAKKVPEKLGQSGQAGAVILHLRDDLSYDIFFRGDRLDGVTFSSDTGEFEFTRSVDLTRSQARAIANRCNDQCRIDIPVGVVEDAYV